MSKLSYTYCDPVTGAEMEIGAETRVEARRAIAAAYSDILTEDSIPADVRHAYAERIECDDGRCPLLEVEAYEHGDDGSIKRFVVAARPECPPIYKYQVPYGGDEHEYPEGVSSQDDMREHLMSRYRGRIGDGYEVACYCLQRNGDWDRFVVVLNMEEEGAA